MLCLSKSVDHGLTVLIHDGRRLGILDLEDALNDTELSACRVQTSKGTPVVNNETSADHIKTTVHRSSHKGDLQERGELLLVLDGGAGMDEATLIAKSTVGADKDVAGDGLAEDFDTEDVGDDLLSLAIQIGMDEGDIVVASDDVSEGRETLLDSLDGNLIGQAVPQMLELLKGWLENI